MSTHLFTWLDLYFDRDRDEDLVSSLLKSKLRRVIKYSWLNTWSFSYRWLHPCHGSIDRSFSYGWLHPYRGIMYYILIPIQMYYQEYVYIRDVIYCIMFDLQVSWRWYSKLLALTEKSLQLSLHILLSCFRGNLLHNILSHSQLYTRNVILCSIVVTNFVKRQKLCKLIHHELYAQYIPEEMEN